jgi:hypothetical protein
MAMTMGRDAPQLMVSGRAKHSLVVQRLSRYISLFVWILTAKSEDTYVLEATIV